MDEVINPAIADEIENLIVQITAQVNQMTRHGPPRQPGDIDLQQLMRAWGSTEPTTRRKMKLCGKHKEKTGFDCVMVYDKNCKHDVLVLRRYVPTA